MSLGKPRRYDEAALKAYALKMLASRALSAGELRDRLRRHAERPEHIEAVMSAMQEYGFTNDTRFAEHFSAARAHSGAVGKQRVLGDLLKKKVNRKVAESAVAEAFSGADETEAVTAWLQRKYRGKDLPEFLAEPKNLAAAFRRLRTAGFSSGASIKVLKRFAAGEVDLEGMEESLGGEPVG
jgi:SOS response regulatory protein OraA/RecX